MSKDRRELEDWEKAECAALKAELAAYNRRAPQGKAFTQESLAQELGMTQGNLNAHLNGRRAISKELAAKMARLLGINVAAFSPRLAHEIEELAIPLSSVIKKTELSGFASETPARYTATAADKVMEMLSKHGKALTDSAQQRLLQAVSDSLAEDKAGNVITADFSRNARVKDGDILIPQYDVRASMGHGQVPADYVEFVRNVVVNGLQLEKLGLEYTSTANLSIITGWGQSMAGTIDDKDPVIVDRGITEFNGDGVYVLTWDNMVYIKRLQKADAEHFDMISDNEKHKDRVVPVGEVTIHARVLYVWKGQKL